jgi:hypothetical protein
LKLDEKELRAVCALRTDPNFKVFLEAIGRAGDTVTKSLIMNETLDSGQLYQLRGKTQAYVAIVEAIMQAPAKLDNIETHREPNHEINSGSEGGF